MTTPATYTTSAEAKAHKAVLDDQWKHHRKMCRTCRHLTSDRNRYCTEGWELSKAMARAASEVRRFASQAGPPPDTLF